MEVFKFKGKTINELNEGVEKADGFDENGNPKWWQVLADLEDAITIKRLMKNIDETILK